jgi:hypothetical protein
MTRPRTTTSTAREITDWSVINLHANGERQRVGGLNATTFVNDRYKPGWSASRPMLRRVDVHLIRVMLAPG